MKKNRMKKIMTIVLLTCFMISGSISSKAETKTPDKEEVVCTQLEKHLKEAKLYQNEAGPVRFRIVYETKRIYRVSVEREDGPSQYTTLNTYDVDKRSGKTYSNICDQYFSLDLTETDTSTPE